VNTFLPNTDDLFPQLREIDCVMYRPSSIDETPIAETPIMNFVALFFHGLIAGPVFESIVGARLLIGSLGRIVVTGLGIGLVATVRLFTNRVLPGLGDLRNRYSRYHCDSDDHHFDKLSIVYAFLPDKPELCAASRLLVVCE